MEEVSLRSFQLNGTDQGLRAEEEEEDDEEMMGLTSFSFLYGFHLRRWNFSLRAWLVGNEVYSTQDDHPSLTGSGGGVGRKPTTLSSSHSLSLFSCVQYTTNPPVAPSMKSRVCEKSSWMRRGCRLGGEGR